jgi:phosphopantothenoylcysteine decarboxylase / phosphopantothenate---cysteine ligase
MVSSPVRKNKRPDPALKIILGITGGIAAYKIPQLIRILKKRNIEVKTVLTEAARSLVGEEALRTVSGNPVFGDSIQSDYDMDHIRLAEWADFCVICPATANTIGKLAHGIADNLLTTIALCFDNKLVIVPAMNTAMWDNRATRENIRQLESRGAVVLPVDKGELACGTRGSGRMLPIESIAEYIDGLKIPKYFTGKRILISSGPTEEPIDPVRMITNRSSGIMGAALAQAALNMGAKVTVVTGPASVPPPTGARSIPVSTAHQMLTAMEREFGTADVCIMAAAVSDYRVAKSSKTKIRRAGKGSLYLELVPNPDIAEALGKKKKRQFLVGFSLEDKPDIKRATDKMKKKKCDLMVLNTVESSMGTGTTSAIIINHDAKPERLGVMEKPVAAREILIRIARHMGRIHE